MEEYEKALSRGLAALKKGGVLVFPTDTVYGLGGDARKIEVIEKIYKMKGRERGKPLAVIMSGFRMIDEWCDLDHEQADVIMQHLPGPYTFIVRLREGKTLAGITGTRNPEPGTGRIGVRVPNHFFLRKLVLSFGAPIAATSANISGRGDASSFGEVEKALLKKVALAIDGGKTALGEASTVVDLVEKKILRNGAGEFKF